MAKLAAVTALAAAAVTSSMAVPSAHAATAHSASAAVVTNSAAHHAVTGRPADELTAVANPDGTVTLENKFSHMCLDDYGFSTAAGNAMVQWPCENPPLDNQKWYEHSLSSQAPIYTLENKFSHMCLDDYGFSTAAGNAMVQWPCGNGLRNQQWQVAGTVVNLFSGMCLDDYGFSTAAGNVMVQWPCDTLDNQTWLGG